MADLTEKSASPSKHDPSKKKLLGAKKEKTTLLFVFSLLVLAFLPDQAKATRLDINTATAAELSSLPDIGVIQAKTIVDCRNTHGPFKELNGLQVCVGSSSDTLKTIPADLEISDNPATPLPLPPQGEKREIPAPTKTSAPGDVTVLAGPDYFPALIDKIRGAKTNIDLAMFVFKTTKSSKDRPSMIITELAAARQWGVRVRVFLEKSGYDDKLNDTNQLTAKRLRDNGIEVIFDSANITTHTKLAIIDRRYSFVGSHNFTQAALKYNNELSLLIDNPELAGKLTDYMQTIINP